MKNSNSKIPKPSHSEVQRYLKKWDTLENYSLQESSLKKFFLKTYPLNNDIDDVLIKVCSLNEFYNTHIFSPFKIAKHIMNLQIDDFLNKSDLTIVDKIAFGHGIPKPKGSGDRSFYSFATKYCSHHKPLMYPIYDSFVDKMLMYCKRKDKFYEFSQEDLKEYSSFKNILLNFRKYYGLEEFNLKEIDKYLWLAGKKYFPNNYGRSKKVSNTSKV